jgi:hypothetical protein
MVEVASEDFAGYGEWSEWSARHKGQPESKGRIVAIEL